MKQTTLFVLYCENQFTKKKKFISLNSLIDRVKRPLELSCSNLLLRSYRTTASYVCTRDCKIRRLTVAPLFRLVSHVRSVDAKDCVVPGITGGVYVFNVEFVERIYVPLRKRGLARKRERDHQECAAWREGIPVRHFR